MHVISCYKLRAAFLGERCYTNRVYRYYYDYYHSPWSTFLSKFFCCITDHLKGCYICASRVRSVCPCVGCLTHCQASISGWSNAHTIFIKVITILVAFTGWVWQAMIFIIHVCAMACRFLLDGLCLRVFREHFGHIKLIWRGLCLSDTSFSVFVCPLYHGRGTAHTTENSNSGGWGVQSTSLLHLKCLFISAL